MTKHLEKIKEILKYIDQFVYVDQTYNDIKLSKIDTKLILDYITNLQQENEKLKEIEKEHKNCTRKHWQQKCAEHYVNEMIYKSRCEKAIEYIKEQELLYYSRSKDIQKFSRFSLDILNILQGSDEE